MAILRVGKPIGVAVHHSVYKPANNMIELKAQASLFNGWHKSKSWAESTKTPSAYPYISYHYLLATDGSLLNVTDEKYVKYHSGDNIKGANSFNLHGIAVCLTGNYDNDIPTEAQMKALVLFIRDVEKRYGIDARVRGHKETSQTATACPGKNLGTSQSGWLKQVITNVNDKNYPPAPVVEPKPDDCIKQVEMLNQQITALKVGVATLEGQLKLAQERVEFLEGCLAVRDSEYTELEDSFESLKQARDALRQNNMELMEELRELKEGRDDWINRLADVLHKLFRRK
jgi:prefoldin subunit 5